jgi:hypothetical protein
VFHGAILKIHTSEDLFFHGCSGLCDGLLDRSWIEASVLHYLASEVVVHCHPSNSAASTKIDVDQIEVDAFVDGEIENVALAAY